MTMVTITSETADGTITTCTVPADKAGAEVVRQLHGDSVLYFRTEAA